MKPLLDGLKALGPARLAAMGAVALGLMTLLAVMALRSGSSDQMALLYGELDPRDAGQIVEQLNRRHVPYRLTGGGAQILVPADQVPESRMLLAKEGLPSGGSIGYELFDRGDAYMFSQFQQKISETRAMEGELARTIRAIRGIRSARVHLVLSRREPFVLRPMVARLTTLGPGALALADGSAAASVAHAGYPGGIPTLLAPTGMAALPSPGGQAGANAAGRTAQQLEDEAMISLSQIEGQMRASSLRKLSDIVGKHPDETLTIMRGWMAQENG